jgi:hypothetical protein
MNGVLRAIHHCVSFFLFGWMDGWRAQAVVLCARKTKLTQFRREFLACATASRRSISCLYSVRIRVSKANLVVALDILPLEGPCSYSFRASHRAFWYAQVS